MDIEISPIIKEKAPLILAEIKKAKSILLHCHPSPDPDSVGSALAMKFALEQLGKKATVIKGDSEIPQAFMHFPGAKDIVQKNFFEIDLKDFDLFIIQDSGSKEMISRAKELSFPLAIKTINIDHHASNKGYADIDLLDTSSPATAFILYQLFSEWNIKINRDIASDLFIGMYTDTGGFKYPPTDHRVFQAASELSRIAPDFNEVIFTMENSNTKESIYFDAIALSSIQLYLNDSVAIASVSQNDLNSKNIPANVAGGSNVENILKSVVGWNIGILMTEVEPNLVKISFRTRDSEKYDVSKLAELLGGGGHRAASGTKLNMSLEAAKNLVVAKAKELYNL